MTYGVDQCRLCGKPIHVRGPTSWEEYEEALKNCRVPEKVWRAQGFLAPPTRRQIRNPADGCCATCGLLAMQRRWRYYSRGTVVAICFVIIATIVAGIAIYLPQ